MKSKVLRRVLVLGLVSLLGMGCGVLSDFEGEEMVYLETEETTGNEAKSDFNTDLEEQAGEQSEEYSEVTTDAENSSAMEVHYIDVGQGDATLIKADGHYMLIDAGDNDKGTRVQNYLQKQGVEKLDYLILTHTDADHIGGADVIINKFPIDTLFLGDYEKDNKTYEELMSAIAYKDLSYSTPEAGTEYALGDAFFTIVAPNRIYDDPNNSSIALMVQNGENSFLFTGDCEEEAEEDILRNGIDIDCDVYKLGHHGSRTASGRAFLESITPEYGVVSCEADNSYGHPHAEPLNNLREMGVQLFRTDEQGSIVAYSDGEEITWNCAPSDTWKAGEPTGSGAIVANKNSKAFHRPDCSHLPKEKNRVYFNSREEALAAGYDNPCDYCSP